MRCILHPTNDVLDDSARKRLKTEYGLSRWISGRIFKGNNKFPE
jgi:hypothetical protein